MTVLDLDHRRHVARRHARGILDLRRDALVGHAHILLVRAVVDIVKVRLQRKSVSVPGMVLEILRDELRRKRGISG
jgi:hypothetical protein